MWADAAMWQSLWTSVLVAVCVVVIVVPVGTAAALVLTSLHARARSFAYAVMVSPLLTPGVVIGISTLILWRQMGVGGGVFLIVLAQSTFIICYVMLMVMARLQRFDRTQEEAALGLGASRVMVFRRVTLPFLRPALIASAGLAVLQSIENYKHHAVRARVRDAPDRLHRDQGPHRPDARGERVGAGHHRGHGHRGHRL